MLRVLRDGDVVLFIRVAENLTGVPGRLVRRLLFESAGEGLAILCRFVELPKAEFLEIFSIAQKCRPVNGERLATDCQRLSVFFDGLAMDAVRKVVLRWRRDTNYLAALREVEVSGSIDG
jgi:hypothetical protein